MTNNKVFLIAVREFKEFVQTKTFWIGILSFPLIFGAAIMIPRWLEKAKDVRTYAVIDESGWLLEAAEARIAVPDISSIYSAIASDEVDFDKLELPAEDVVAMKELAKVLAKLDENQRNQLAEVTTRMFIPGGIPEEAFEFLPEDTVNKALPEALATMTRWYKALAPKESSKVASGLSKSQYQKVDIEETGEAAISKLTDMVKKDELFAYFVIGPDPVQGSEGCRYVSKNLTDDDLKKWIARGATAEVRDRRLLQANVPEETVAFVQKPLVFEEFGVADKATGPTEELEKVEQKDKLRAYAPIAFVYMLWIAVFTVAQMLLTNTIEEKSNRIIEVLLSSASPFQLMSGKIYGIAATGMTVIMSWAFFAFIGIKFIMPMVFPGGLDFDLSFIVSDPIFLASFILYFMGGYLLYAALLVGMGSVCNSLKEAQNLMQPVILLLMVPLLAMIFVSQDPNGRLATALSYVPFFTPFVMMNRAAGPPPAIDYVLTSILLVATILFCFWAAAKVFRIGILMTGKPPKIREILRWIRAPVGAVAVRKDD